jgi:Ca2+-binding RTX toxin-like protein
MTRRLTHGKFRIVVAAVVATALSTIGGVAAADPPEREFSIDFRDSSGTIVIPCLVKSTTNNVVSARVTKVSQQGPHIRGAEITPASGFTVTNLGNPSTNTGGTWSGSFTSTSVSLSTDSGQGQLKGGDWVQAPITVTAPAIVGQHTWSATASGPGNHSYTRTGAVPVINVVNSLSECPTGAGGTIAGAGPCVRPTIGGTAGDDLIVGTPGNDVIVDLLGNNTVLGSGGNDIICTGPGNDRVRTLGGSDVAWDQGGRNVIGVGPGNDNVTLANGGPNKVRTGPGNDTVSAGRGKNQIRTQGGKDRVLSGDGADVVKSGGGKDTVNAGAGKNKLNGGAGNDRLKAGKGKDRLNGAKGRRDVCNGGKGKTNSFRACERATGRGS